MALNNDEVKMLVEYAFYLGNVRGSIGSKSLSVRTINDILSRSDEENRIFLEKFKLRKISDNNKKIEKLEYELNTKITNELKELRDENVRLIDKLNDESKKLIVDGKVIDPEKQIISDIN